MKYDKIDLINTNIFHIFFINEKEKKKQLEIRTHFLNYSYSKFCIKFVNNSGLSLISFMMNRNS